MIAASQTPPDCPDVVADFARQALEYVRRATGLSLEWNSETLPILDHYLLETKKAGEDETARGLVAATTGAYFGEVMRLTLGGSWSGLDGDPGSWRMVLPGGLSFVPAGLCLAAIEQSDDVAIDSKITAPGPMAEIMEQALERMGQLSEAEYFSLGGRHDTLVHLQQVLLATAAERLKT